jgi:hypothetical protein
MVKCRIYFYRGNRCRSGPFVYWFQKIKRSTCSCLFLIIKIIFCLLWKKSFLLFLQIKNNCPSFFNYNAINNFCSNGFKYSRYRIWTKLPKARTPSSWIIVYNKLSPPKSSRHCPLTWSATPSPSGSSSPIESMRKAQRDSWPSIHTSRTRNGSSTRIAWVYWSGTVCCKPCLE